MAKVNGRKALAFTHDVTASAVAWVLAFWLRLNLEIPREFVSSVVQGILWLLPLHALLFWRFGLYRGIWRYASLPDLHRILLAVGAAAVAGPALLFLLRFDQAIPRAVFILHPLLLVVLMGGSRVAYRVWKERRLYGAVRANGELVVVIGAGDAAVSLLKELDRSPNWRVAGVIDDDASKQGLLVNGIKVIGHLSDLPRIAEEYSVEKAIIAMPDASHQVRRRAVDAASQAGMRVLTVPSYDDLISGKVTVSAIRKVELEDLLGRDPVVLDDASLHELLTGRVVMVTGAGGSIGSELVRQILRFKPGLLVLYELSEYALYQIEQELADRGNPPVVCVAGDVKDAERLDRIIGQYRPAVIFHAAAYKHVPLMETGNAWEAVRNNVLGTLYVAQAALAHEVEKFVLISTDKAVNPTNVMGATKRLAEMVCGSLQENGRTRFVVVRFGNVLGSSGSVIPRFREQIARGGPVTVTHPEIRRFFMSIPEAAQLVLQAAHMGQGGEIFVLDMGEPVKIVDLARDMIRLSGFSEEEIRIVFTGLRPGEKLYEEVLADGERTLPTVHPKLRVAKARDALGQVWLADLQRWLEGPAQDDPDQVRRQLAQRVPEYQPRGAAETAAPAQAQAGQAWQPGR
ncbi:MAG: nucleoside-diphosphate sugar epimerase/dehydratase [Pseudomonadota bacterium]|jgi:FlaA1/EpsC-like NDP-sugar epimerase